MQLKTCILSLALLLVTYSVNGQSAVGTWKTVDDNTGEAKSHIEIYEDNGVLYGKVTSLLLKPADTICEACKGDKKDQPLIGMILLQDLVAEKDYWSGGTIMDPENGKSYKCKISLDGPDKLKVRGYIGIEALGRSQYWHRVQ